MEQFHRGELVFDVIDEGPADGPVVVVLLHGFPQFNSSWEAVISRLTAQGYRCLAPNQRGYSRGAACRFARSASSPSPVNCGYGGCLTATSTRYVSLRGSFPTRRLR
jgi:pimeloyl-ACP methyl ester carboxylesterase